MNRVQYSCILQSCCLYEPIKKDEEGSKKIQRQHSRLLAAVHAVCVCMHVCVLCNPGERRDLGDFNLPLSL